MKGEESSMQSLAGKHSERWHDTSLQLQADATSLDKWILAACLTINGGGALAVLSNEKIERTSALIAGGAFSLGTLFCILFAMIHVRLIRAAQTEINKASTAFLRYELGQITDIEEIFESENELAKLERNENLAYLLNYGSLILFCIGVIALGALRV